MKKIIFIFIFSHLLFAKVVVEKNGQVIHIYDIPNSQITNMIVNVKIDKNVDSFPLITSKDIVNEKDSIKELQKIDFPIDSRVCDTFSVISKQLKFLFHKPLNVQSIKMSWTNGRNLTLQD